MHKSNINLDTIIKKNPKTWSICTGVSLLEAWRLQIHQLLLLQLLLEASNGSYTV
jgi:hypothetical protein